MVSSAPAHALPLRGSAYRYGPTVVGGTKNFASNGSVLHPLPSSWHSTTTFNLILANSYDAAVNAQYAAAVSFLSDMRLYQSIIVNGELLEGATNTTNYGAFEEVFNQNGTVTVTNGSTSVTGVGTTFTTDTLAGPYAYPPNKNKIYPGDLLAIGLPGSRHWYRIVSVNAATGAGALTIFPAYAGTTGTFNYLTTRTGFGSMSRVVCIPKTPTNVYAYWAGNRGGPLHGTIEAVNTDGVRGSDHYMAPQSVDILGAGTGFDIEANDIIYYKEFLLYGAGTAISWSVAGFPTAFPFGATDFPAANISVIDPSDTFVAFENLGDQVVAIFANGIYLVQATGIVPEFAFYRLPEATGASLQFTANAQVPTIRDYGRPTCSGRAAVFYVGAGGLMKLAGGVAESVSVPIQNELQSGGLLTVANGCALSWEPSLDEVWWRDLGATGLVLTYSNRLNEWKRLDMTTVSGTAPVGLTAGRACFGTGFDLFRAPRIACLDTGGSAILVNVATPDVEQDLGLPYSVAWSNSTPLLDLGALVPGYRFGGFFIFARKTAAATAPVNLTWTVYAGSSPYNMTSRGTGTFDYSQGFLNQRSPIGPTLDESFVGVVLSGTKWIELEGVFVVATDSKAGR